VVLPVVHMIQMQFYPFKNEVVKLFFNKDVTVLVMNINLDLRPNSTATMKCAFLRDKTCNINNIGQIFTCLESIYDDKV